MISIQYTIDQYFVHEENKNLLNNIIQFDCDTPDKEKRYKQILFIHYTFFQA